jgi:hypothetical protein
LHQPHHYLLDYRYIAASSFRFFATTATDTEIKADHVAILHGKTVDLRRDVFQVAQLKPQNGNLHKSTTPSQGVLVLAESAEIPRQRKNALLSLFPTNGAQFLKSNLECLTPRLCS